MHCCRVWLWIISWFGMGFFLHVGFILFENSCVPTQTPSSSEESHKQIVEEAAARFRSHMAVSSVEYRNFDNERLENRRNHKQSHSRYGNVKHVGPVSFLMFFALLRENLAKAVSFPWVESMWQDMTWHDIPIWECFVLCRFATLKNVGLISHDFRQCLTCWTILV